MKIVYRKLPTEDIRSFVQCQLVAVHGNIAVVLEETDSRSRKVDASTLYDSPLGALKALRDELVGMLGDDDISTQTPQNNP